LVEKEIAITDSLEIGRLFGTIASWSDELMTLFSFMIRRLS